MKKELFLFLLILPSLLYSNGGPVDMSHFRKTGNIRLMTKKNVLLKKEDLKIKLLGDYTEIDVVYELQNLGKKQEIQYGFPVDAFETRWYWGDPYVVFSKENDCLVYFEAYANKEPLKVSQWIVDSLYRATTVNLNEGGVYHKKGKRYQVVRKWSAITLAFEEQEIKTVRIKYKIKNTLRDKHPGFKFIHRFTDRNFTYDLNPSSNWGNGVVEEFNLEIDLRDLSKIGCKYSLDGVDLLEVEKGYFTRRMTNFDLHKARRINIHYNNIQEKMSDFIDRKEISKFNIKSINSSSNNERARNLIDGSSETTWSGKSGDWIEIKMKEKKIGDPSIRGILALNGDYSNGLNHRKRGQLKEIRIVINDSLLFNTEPWEGEAGKRIIELPKSEFRLVEERKVKGLATILADGNDFYIKLDKIRIEILATYGEDVTLSELFFVGS